MFIPAFHLPSVDGQTYMHSSIFGPLLILSMLFPASLHSLRWRLLLTLLEMGRGKKPRSIQACKLLALFMRKTKMANLVSVLMRDDAHDDFETTASSSDNRFYK